MRSFRIDSFRFIIPYNIKHICLNERANERTIERIKNGMYTLRHFINIINCICRNRGIKNIERVKYEEIVRLFAIGCRVVMGFCIYVNLHIPFGIHISMACIGSGDRRIFSFFLSSLLVCLLLV